MAFQIHLPATLNPMTFTMRQDDHAYGLLSLAMARAAHNWAENDTAVAEFIAREFDIHQLVFYHLHLSNLENIAQSLTELQVLKEVAGSGCYFTFAHEMTEVAKVAVSHREEGPDFQHMLHYFCYHFSDYGTDYYGLNFHIDTPFCPQRGMGDVIDALAELGYARRLGVGSVVLVENPGLSRRLERAQFRKGMGKPCFIWTERMQAIAADGVIWDELEDLSDRI